MKFTDGEWIKNECRYGFSIYTNNNVVVDSSSKQLQAVTCSAEKPL